MREKFSSSFFFFTLNFKDKQSSSLFEEFENHFDNSGKEQAEAHWQTGGLPVQTGTPLLTPSPEFQAREDLLPWIPGFG